LDHARIVHQVRRSNYLPLIQKYLLFVQKDNVREVNEAVNELYVEEEDHKNLRTSIDTYQTFNRVDLAQRLQKHPLLEMRRVSAYLFKLEKRWDTSIELSKHDQVYSDVIKTASESQDEKIAEGVLQYFITEKQHACFAASLYACYNVIRADVVLELAWRHKLTEMVMPFMIQVFRDYNDRIRGLEKKFEDQEEAARKAAEEEKKKEESVKVAVDPLGLMTTNTILALPAAPSIMGYGAPPPPAPFGYGMGPPPMGVPPQMGGYPGPGQFGGF